MISETVITEIGGTTIANTTIGSAFAKASEWSGPETILLVEDEAFVRAATAEVLESAGYRLVIAGSAAEALEAYRTCSLPVDLLLADIVMPGMNGRELATELERLYPRARVLLMSGYAEQLAGCALFPNGAECLVKPFSVHALLSRVREVLGHEKESATTSHCEGALQEEAGATKLSERALTKSVSVKDMRPQGHTRPPHGQADRTSERDQPS
jgi:DNA-binding response OmpR family regulator